MECKPTKSFQIIERRQVRSRVPKQSRLLRAANVTRPNQVSILQIATSKRPTRGIPRYKEEQHSLTVSLIPTSVRDGRTRSLTELRTADEKAFFGRLKFFMKALAHEGIKLELPSLVLDLLAINELNFKQLIFRVRRCASNGQEIENDGLKLFKLRAVDIDAKEGLPSEEWMVILNCDEPEGNHAIF